MNPPTPKEQIEALQSELIQLRKRGDRTESRQDNRHAELEILGKLGIAYYQDQEWHSAIAILTEYLNLARELGNQTNEAVAHYYLGFTQQAIAEFEQAVAAFFQGYRLFRQLQQHEFAAQLWQQLVQQGQRYLQNQQVPEAVALYKRQIQILLEFDDLKASAEIAVELGKVYYSQPDFPEAIGCFTSALDTAQTLKDQTLENVALAWLGCSHWQGGDLSQGLQYLEQRLALVQQLKNTAAQQETLTWLIQICQQLDNPDKLIQSYQLQANFWQQQGEPVNQHLSLYELAIYQFNRQQYPEALSGFQLALELANTLNDDQGKSWKTANNNYMLGECYRNLGENQAAIFPYEQAVELYLQLGAKDWAKKGLEHLLNLYRELQQLEQEIDCQKKRFQLIQDKGEDIKAQSLAYEIGNLYNRRQQFTQALEYYQEALILAKKLEQPQNLANAAYMVGQCYRNLGQQQVAISPYEQAVELYLQLGVKEWAEKGLEHLLNLYRELQQLEQEIDCQKKRFQLIQDKGEDIKAQSLAYEIGNLYNRRQQFTQALEYYQEALILAKKLEQQKNIANAAYMVGQCYRNLGQQQAAISGYEQAVGLYLEVKETKWALSGLDYLVNLYRELGQYEEVIASYQRRLEILRELGDAKAEQSCLYNIGSLYDDLKQWENALKYFDLALSLAQKLKLKHSQANAHYMQGQCCRNLGQQQAAISGYEQAVELYVEVKETKWALSGLDYLVNLYRELKQDEQVIASYQRRLEIFRELGDRTSEHSCLYDLVTFQFNTQKYQDALSGFEAALQIAETLTEDSNQTYKLANSRYMMGQCCQNLGQAQAAIAHYQQATGLYIELGVKDWAAKALDYQGTLQKELNNYEQALAAQEQRLGLLQELNEPASKQSCLYNIGCILNYKKQWTRALEYFGQALSLAVELEQKPNEANAHYMLAQCYESLGDFQLAEESTQRAKNLYQSLGNDEWEEICQNSLSRLAAKANQYERSRFGQDRNTDQRIQQALQQFWLQLLQVAMESGWDQAAMHQVMRQNMELIVPALGETIAQSMLGLLAQNPNQAEGVAALIENTCASIMGFPDGRYGEALEIAMRGYDVVLALRADNPKKRAGTLNNLGIAYGLQAELGLDPAANLGQAITAYTEAASILRCPGLEKDLASTLNNLGVAYKAQAELGLDPVANLGQAITAYTEAASILRRPGLEKDLASTLNNLGVAYKAQAELGLDPVANLSHAITAYTEAASILRCPGLEKDLAGTLTNLGVAYTIQAELSLDPAANLSHAITAYTEAASILRRPGLEKDLASTLANLGVAYTIQAELSLDPAANLSHAITAYTEAASILRCPGLEKDLASTLANLGNAYQTQADLGLDPATNLDQAITVYTESATILRRPGLEKDLAVTLTNLGITYGTQAELGLDPAANLGQAITAYTEAASILRRSGLQKNLASTLNNCGFAYHAQSHLPSNSPDQKQTALENAYRSFAEALEQVEYLRGEITTEGYKRNFNEQWNRIYRGMVEVCLEVGNYNAAIEYVDRSKARNLTELIATRDAYPGGVIPPEDRQCLQQLRQAIFEENRRLQEDLNPDYGKVNQLRQEFQEKFPYQPLHFEQIQELLDEETAILEWYILADKFLTFTLTNQTLNLWESSHDDRQNLIDWGNAYLRDYRNNKTQWHNKLPQRLEELAQILHLDEILHNLREKFPNCKKLILIPHRFLHLLPIHALPVPVIATDGVGAQCLRPISRQNGHPEGLHIAPLQELFPKGVAYAPNCQVLQQAQNRQRPDFNQLFAIQNPTKDLDFTDIEVAAIQSLFNPHHILQYDAAEKAAILDGDNLKNAHCTHFSCHGYFNFEDALKSALLLAKSEFTPPPPNEDKSRYIPLQNGNLLDLGKCLTIEDILRLDLTNCRLVTLSACETGITDFNSTSDEYIGLPSGFILAGAPNVVCSLWAVNDLSTALLMIRFYQNVKTGETVPLALKQAQIWLRDVTVEGLQVWSEPILATLDPFSQEELRSRLSKMDLRSKPFASPYYWAGFCAIGV
ncbi:tetratricopeptide repeat protein [Oscillatoria acuminata]|uniref:CHAT domain-containing protein n=1 Tax=Oscillatoria acuminata PCC 6304 TaxID=56110 RepID=K9TQ50_9CYAN|nr:tetratricopeptide repeat protein [Oscillatoria acuminata]AFY84538.1 hypothetical protein Oscil6304_5036 [Oscillatoria acuminata PCC 6304]